MRWKFDTFNLYNTLSDAALGRWDSYSGASGLSGKTPFAVGQSINFNHGLNMLVKDGYANAGTVFAACRMFQSGALGGATAGAGITFRDGGTAQFSISFSGDGSITLRRGDLNGTIVATFPGAIPTVQWNQYQFKVICDPAAGEFHVRKNGNTVDDFSATGLNTRATANSFVNGVSLGQGDFSGGWYMYNFASWDTAGGDQFHDWVGDLRGDVNPPNLDVSANWTKNNGGSTAVGNQVQSGGNTRAVAANTITTTNQMHPTSGGTFTTMDVNFNAGFAGNAIVAVFRSNGDTSSNPNSDTIPGTLVAVSNVLNNPVGGVNAFTFASPVPLENLYYYFFAILTDTACVIKAGGNDNIYTMNQPYGSGFPSFFVSSGSAFTVTPLIYVPALTTTNSGLVNDYKEDGSTTFLSSSTVNQQDLYGIEPPPGGAIILAVDVCIFGDKSDAGGRQFAGQVKSGGTTTTGPTVTPTTSKQYYAFPQDVDPNTAAQWLAANLANANLGLKVIS